MVMRKVPGQAEATPHKKITPQSRPLFWLVLGVHKQTRVLIGPVMLHPSWPDSLLLQLHNSDQKSDLVCAHRMLRCFMLMFIRNLTPTDQTKEKQRWRWSKWLCFQILSFPLRMNMAITVLFFFLFLSFWSVFFLHVF